MGLNVTGARKSRETVPIGDELKRSQQCGNNSLVLHHSCIAGVMNCDQDNKLVIVKLFQAINSLPLSELHVKKETP